MFALAPYRPCLEQHVAGSPLISTHARKIHFDISQPCMPVPSKYNLRNRYLALKLLAEGYVAYLLYPCHNHLIFPILFYRLHILKILFVHFPQALNNATLLGPHIPATN